MILSKNNLKNIATKQIAIPDEKLFQLPEKVLQFGTGVLLRGLPDYFIDKANRKGVFNGRIVVVNLYTISVKGIENGTFIEEDTICSSISRVLTASSDWKDILSCAHNSDMQIVISNTTEVGIQYIEEKITDAPPESFPAKLLAFLMERYKTFKGSKSSGMVIIPTELIPDNGTKLKRIVSDLALYNNMDPAFMSWLAESNYFCNSLVDRIVPGKPDDAARSVFEKQMGFTDQLHIICEAYSLWAIQGDEHVKSVLSFSPADKGVIIVPNIDIYRELKLRLLNGAHTLSCGLAFLGGLETVKSAMDDELFSSYIRYVMTKEIASAIPYPVEKDEALEFANKVLDRFRNPHICHLWHTITTQYSTKMKMRVLPVLLEYYKLYKTVPEGIAAGIAAWILFMKAIKKENEKYYGEYEGKVYHINDDQAGWFHEQWKQGEENIVQAVLKAEILWNADLSKLDGFQQAVNRNLESMTSKGIKQTLRSTINL
jgi:tagaturonate reductase